jgi:hypothetical protein
MLVVDISATGDEIWFLVTELRLFEGLKSSMKPYRETFLVRVRAEDMLIVVRKIFLEPE